MPGHSFRLLTKNDHLLIDFISECYHDAWNVPHQKTRDRMNTIISDAQQFQIVMFIDDEPVSTGGLYTHVSLQDHVPRFAAMRYWLGMVYTIEPARKKGYGGLLCSEIESLAAKQGVETIYLFTDTAEHLYTSLGWHTSEKVAMGPRLVSVMQKQIAGWSNMVP